MCGSGKSTLAERLSEILKLPYHSVDDIAWLPGWQSRPEAEEKDIFDSICQGESWILDTAYGKWLDVVLPRVDIIIALDYSRSFSFFRLVKRTLVRIRNGKPICNGNVETWKKALSKDSILIWHFKSFERKRIRIQNWKMDPQSPPTLVFRTSKDLDRWLESIS